MTAAELLSVAAFDAGHHAQAFPSFGSERTGAPVVAYCRIDDAPIRTREPIVTPDALIIQDVTLLPHADVLSGLPADAYVLLNSEHTPQQLGLADFVAGHRADRIVQSSRPRRSRSSTSGARCPTSCCSAGSPP